MELTMAMAFARITPGKGAGLGALVSSPCSKCSSVSPGFLPTQCSSFLSTVEEDTRRDSQLQLQVRASANLASSSSSVSGRRFSGEFSARKNVHVLNQKGRRITVQVTADGDGREEPPEGSSERRNLEQLDQQLKFLSGQDSARLERLLRTSEDSAEQKKAAEKTKVAGGSGPLQFPELSSGFFAVAGIGLMLLTLANNILYKIFLGPPVADKSLASRTSVVQGPRYRITTLSEEREAREVKEAQRQALENQVKEAPPLTTE